MKQVYFPTLGHDEDIEEMYDRIKELIVLTSQKDNIIIKDISMQWLENY